MARAPKPPAGPRPVEVFIHDATRRNIPTAELQSLAQQVEERAPVEPVRYPRARPLPPGTIRPRDPDRDPQVIWNGVRLKLSPAQVRQLQDTGEVELGDAQLVWRGKDTQDWSDLVVQPPPIYVQEKVHPKAIMADLQRQAAVRKAASSDMGPDLFADFNGLPDPEARLEFYQHDQHWSNRMILGDSLQVMASLAEREGLRGKVQCIYFDPPYGIKFNSNWQVSTQSRDVKDGKREDVSREPEQVKAFRDTWKDGIHSYLTYLRDRLTVARELLTESGSIFVQIGDENVHRVRAVMDEIFGTENFVVLSQILRLGCRLYDEMARIWDETMAIDFKGSHFERDIILWGVRWYVAYPISYRQLEEMMGERGVEVDHSTLNRWIVRYVPLLEKVFVSRKRPVGDSWRLDETYVRIKGEWKYLYRAVDKAGATVDFLLTAKRDRKAALRFMRKAVRHHSVPEKITIDKSGANMAAIESYNVEHDAEIEIRQVNYLNNIVEQDHRAVKRLTRPMLGFKSFWSAAITIAGIEIMHMIRKGQLRSTGKLRPAQQFYSLAN